MTEKRKSLSWLIQFESYHVLIFILKASQNIVAINVYEKPNLLSLQLHCLRLKQVVDSLSSANQSLSIGRLSNDFCKVSVSHPHWFFQNWEVLALFLLINNYWNKLLFQTAENSFWRKGQDLLEALLNKELITTQIPLFSLELHQFFINSALKTAYFCPKLDQLRFFSRSFIVTPNVDGTVQWIHSHPFQ